MKIIKTLTSLLLFTSITLSQAQEFTYHTAVNKVKTSAYYKIYLSSELLGKLNSTDSDLRIFNEKSIEQPYFFQQSNYSIDKSEFIEYEVIEKSVGEDTISSFIFENPDKNKINNISIVVTNTDIRKRAILSGSHDKNNWYIIKNDFLLQGMKSSEDTSELKILNFPLSNYQYFKLELNDEHELPINILRIGYHKTKAIQGELTSFNCNITSVIDSNNTSYYKIGLPELSYLEQLHFDIADEFYDRKAILKVQRTRINKKKKEVSYFETIASFNLSSKSDNIISLGSRKLKEFYIEIANKDNQALNINKISASYSNKYLVANLNKDKEYELRFGNQSLNSPDYDIKQFTNEISVESEVIKHGDIIKHKSSNQKSNIKSFYESTYFIWTVIVVVGLLIAFISIKMIKELK